VSVKKVRGKGKDKGKAKRPAKRSAPTKSAECAPTKTTKDMAQVRESIKELVKNSAEAIATAVIKVAKSGQLASAKYLFEAWGVHPATEESKENPESDSSAVTMLKRVRLLTEAATLDEEEEPSGRASLDWTVRSSSLRAGEGGCHDTTTTGTQGEGVRGESIP
jgi:hypothetical protein